jgi:hypothetical protein
MVFMDVGGECGDRAAGRNGKLPSAALAYRAIACSDPSHAFSIESLMFPSLEAFTSSLIGTRDINGAWLLDFDLLMWVSGVAASTIQAAAA